MPFFDKDFYLQQNPDVAKAVEEQHASAVEHFLLYGQNEPRYINPFINLSDYVAANSDLVPAIESGWISPLAHLLTYGIAEGRDLGNGIDLSIFENDPKFAAAIESGDYQAALDRVAEVAPFLPTFEAPEGWEPAEDTPVPLDFTPPEGTKLVVPPSVKVPEGVELPEDIFEPVTPEEPVDPEEPEEPVDPEEPEEPVDPEEPEEPGEPGDEDEDEEGETDTLTDKTDTFVGTVGDDTFKGKIEHLNLEDALDGGQGNNALILDLSGAYNFSNFGNQVDKVSLTRIQTVIFDHKGVSNVQGQIDADLGVFDSVKEIWQTNYALEGDDPVEDIAALDIIGVREGVTVGYESSANKTGRTDANITFAGSVGNIALKETKEVMFSITGPSTTELNISGSISGEGKLNFDALPETLTTVNLAMEGDNPISIGMWGQAETAFVKVTKLDASDSTTGLEFTLPEAPWGLKEILLGSGNDKVAIAVDSWESGDKLSIDVGAGEDHLVLSAQQDSPASATVSITNSAGTLDIDASGLKVNGNISVIEILDVGQSTTIKLAEIDDGNKGDLGDGTSESTPKSNQTVKLGDFSEADSHGTLVIQNMTIATANPDGGWLPLFVTNDVIDFSAWGMDGVVGFDAFTDLITSFTVSKSDLENNYLDLTISFDLTEDDVADFTLVLENFLGAEAYNATVESVVDMLVDLEVIPPEEVDSTEVKQKYSYSGETIVFNLEDGVADGVAAGFTGVLVLGGTFDGVALPTELL